MPLFDFQCESCETTFEFFVRAGEKPSCPQCHGDHLQKLMSAPAGHVVGGTSRGLPIASSCPPRDAPPCHPHCCRIQQ
jgi:putative FmdB family regulatory protein